MSEAHSKPLAHHFESLEQQNDTCSIGMWAFLVQEVMFFGGLFTAYLVYRSRHPEAWADGSHHLDVVIGTINTAVLIGSSLTMALAVRAAQLGRRRGTAGFIGITMGLGLAFLIIKWVFEYSHKWDLALVPGLNWVQPPGEDPNVQLFMGLYFVMTGMHAIHILIGLVLMAFVAVRALRGRYSPRNYIGVEVLGLYWHFVDLVWIFLFPLLYLLGREAAS